ncbi:hypothetical protein BJY04DRAFT_228118 [Aspergillus karnatakaensis]|uniref:uncharacterized protein n=1 Tax=Aspergillus karnatakaensis TaxID=1810916 RepID=UPI003CCD4316
MPLTAHIKKWKSSFHARRNPDPNAPHSTSRPSSPAPRSDETSASGAISSKASDPVPLKLAGLWKEAYEDLQVKNPDLLDRYENILLSQDGLPSDDHVCSTDVDPRIVSLVNRRLDAIKCSRLKIRIRGREIEVREQISRLVNGIVSAKDVIASAVNTEPHASVAWAGLMLLLDPLARSFQQEEEALDGLQAVSDLMVRYTFLEQNQTRIYSSQHCNQVGSGQHLAELIRSKTVDLYAAMLLYSMSLVTHFFHAGLTRFFQGWANPDNWSELLESIKDIDTAIRDHWKVFAENDIQKVVSDLEHLQLTVYDSFGRLKEKFEESQQRELLDKLPFESGARFDSFEDRDRTECLEGTCTGILNQIQTWAESPDDHQIYWLRGMAGTGRSTISRTFADACQPQKVHHLFLGASFFFDRAKSGRNSENHLIGTQSLHNQWNKLILEPLLALEQEILLPVTLVLLVDALDEAVSDDPKESSKSSDDVKQVLKLLSTAKELQNIRLKIFITSRPEIYSQFRHGVPEQIYVREHELRKISVVLDATETLSKDDITLYLEHNIHQLALQKPSDYLESTAETAAWLSEHEARQIVRTLADKSDGLFIYAATACRFLDGVSCDLNDLKERVQLLSGDGIEEESPQDNLDRTYSQILRYCVTYSHRKTKAEKAKFYEIYQRIVRAVVLLAEPLSTKTLELLLNLSEWGAKKARSLLSSLSYVLSTGDNFTSKILLLHTSFRDFLLGQPARRCLYDEFCIHPEEVHTALFQSCLTALSNTLKQDICCLDDPSALVRHVDPLVLKKSVPSHVWYASRYWLHHFLAAGLEPFDNSHLYEFLKTYFLYWLEVLSLGQMIPAATLSLIKLSDYLNLLPRDGRAELQDMVLDMKRFLLTFKLEIEKAPLQICHSALVFSPELSFCRRNFHDLIPKSLSRLPRMKQDWGLQLQALDSPQGIKKLVVSPDGKIVIALSAHLDFRHIYIWDVLTGTQLNTIITPPYGGMNLIAILPGNKRILSYRYREGGVKIWDIESGVLIKQVTLGDDSIPDSIAYTRSSRFSFSDSGGCLGILHPSEMKVAFICGDQGLLGELETQEAVYIMRWSADGSIIALALTGGTIQFYDARESVHHPELCPGYGVGRGLNITFTPDGNLLTVTLLDDSVLMRLWDWKKRSLVWEISDASPEWKDPIDVVEGSILVLQRTRFILSRHRSPDLRIWDCQTAARPRLRKFAAGAFEISPNGELLAFAKASAYPGNVIASLRDPRPLLEFKTEKGIFVWDLSSGSTLEPSGDHLDPIKRVILSADEQFALSYDGRQVGHWDVQNGSLIQMVDKRETWDLAGMVGRALSPEFKGSLLTQPVTNISANLDTHTHELLDRLVHALFDVSWAALSSNGRFIGSQMPLTKEKATVGTGHCVKVLYIMTGKVVYHTNCRDNMQHETHYLSFSPDSGLLAICTSYLEGPLGLRTEIWDVNTWCLLLDQTSMSDRGTCRKEKPMWSADGTKVAFHYQPDFDPGTTSLFLCDLTKRNSAAVINRNSHYEGGFSLWTLTGGKMLQTGETRRIDDSYYCYFDSDSTIVTGHSRIHVQSFEPNWDSSGNQHVLIENGWVVSGRSKVLIPSQHRPSSLVVTKNNVLIMGHYTGRLTFWEFANNPAS